MDKEFHLYLAHAPEDSVNEYSEVMHLIDQDVPVIKTTQVMTCTTRLFDRDYRIFVHSEDDDWEITLGKCQRTDREIRSSHNLPNLIINGEFSPDKEKVQEFFALDLTTLYRGNHPTAAPIEQHLVYVYDSEETRNQYAQILDTNFDEDGYPPDDYDNQYFLPANRQKLVDKIIDDSVGWSNNIEHKDNKYYVGRFEVVEDVYSTDYYFRIWMD